MGKYKIERFIIEQSPYCCETCNITIVGKPNINPEDMKMVKDYIEGLVDFDHPIRINVSTPSLTELADSANKYLMVARGNGKTRYFQDWVTRSILENSGIGITPIKVIFHDPATIVFWNDGTKTVVKCQQGDTYNKEMGLALCFTKKMLGNRSNFNNEFKKWIPEEKNDGT